LEGEETGDIEGVGSHGEAAIFVEYGRVAVWTTWVRLLLIIVFFGLIGVDFEFLWEGKDLLNLADVAFKSMNAFLGVQVPEFNRAIIRGGEYGAGSGVDFDGIDPVSMAA
jgi:hypothetical protein